MRKQYWTVSIDWQRASESFIFKSDHLDQSPHLPTLHQRSYHPVITIGETQRVVKISELIAGKAGERCGARTVTNLDGRKDGLEGKQAGGRCWIHGYGCERTNPPYSPLASPLSYHLSDHKMLLPDQFFAIHLKLYIVSFEASDFNYVCCIFSLSFHVLKSFQVLFCKLQNQQDYVYTKVYFNKQPIYYKVGH